MPYPPLHNFTPFTPPLTLTIRSAREAMWRDLELATHKPRRTKRPDALPGKPSRRAAKVQLPPGLTPEQSAIVLAAFKSQGLI